MRKLTALFNLKTKKIYLNSVVVYESKLEIKATSPAALSEIMFTSVVIYKAFCMNYLLNRNAIALA